MKKEVWIGLDQSYTDTGIAVVCDGDVKSLMHESFQGLSEKYQKRLQLSKRLEGIISRLEGKYAVNVCIEAVRLFSGEQPHISTQYIFAACAMVGAIVEVCCRHGVPVYWVETRSWKKAVLGSSKPSGKRLNGVNDQRKVDSVLYAIKRGFRDDMASTVKSGKNRGKVRYNDNMADALCIAICGSQKKKLKNIGNF